MNGSGGAAGPDTTPLRLVVLGDSTAFTDHRGPQLPEEPSLFPNVVAERLAAALGRPVSTTVVARPGLAVREAWTMVTKDRHVQFEVLRGADAVVVAIGSFDHAPAGVPPSLSALVPFVRPAELRRRVRSGLRTAYPWLVRATGARRPRTPAREFDRLYDGLLQQVRGLTQGAAGAVLGPTSHRSAYYAHRHPGHGAAEARQLAIAHRHGFASVAAWPLVRPHADRLNVDGIHWPPEAHAAVGTAIADALAPQLRGDVPPPGVPRIGGT